VRNECRMLIRVQKKAHTNTRVIHINIPERQCIDMDQKAVFGTEKEKSSEEQKTEQHHTDEAHTNHAKEENANVTIEVFNCQFLN